MSILRRAILAAVLTAGLVPAIAAPPPPVPALPDTERRTIYTISASTCGCAVGFALYGDSTDYANWLTVWVNGVQIPQSGNWTLASPSGQFTTLPRPITDAVLTFAAPQTGTVQIVGARRPRRVSQFGNTVPSRDLNQAVTDIVAQVRELWDRQTRTVQAPPGDTLNTLPPASSRANQFYGFDSNGAAALYPVSPSAGGSVPVVGNNEVLANTSGVSALPVGRSLSAWFDSAVCSNIGATVRRTLLGWACARANELRPQDYNAACDGTTNDAGPLAVWVSAISSSGRAGYIPAGSTCNTGSTLSLPSNTTILGADRESSVIKGTGSANPVFSIVDKSNVTLSNFWCKGSDSLTSWTVTNIGCLALVQDSAVTSVTNINFRRMKMSGFNANYWVYISAGGTTTLSISNIDISDNYVVSALADVPTDPVANNNSSTAFVVFSGSAGAGQIIDLTFRNNQIDGANLCAGISLFGNMVRPRIEGNTINSIGANGVAHCVNGTGDAHNAYAILVYDVYSDGHPPGDGRIQNNMIFAPWSTGIYLAGDGNPAHTAVSYNDWRFLISGNLIDGQASDEDTTLPRGSIVINDAANVAVVGNVTFGGFGGITAAGQTAGIVTIAGNTCTSGQTSTSVVSCIKVGAPVVSNTAEFLVKGNVAKLAAAGSGGGSAIYATTGGGGVFHTVEVSNNSIESELNGATMANLNVTKSFTVKGNKFGGTAANWMLNVGANTGGAPAVLTDNIFDSSGGVSGNGLLAQAATIHMANNSFVNRTSGSVAMLRLDNGTCGTMTGTRFANVVQAAQVAAGSLGLAIPSGCTLNYMDQVQNLNPTEIGSGGFGTSNQKYKVDHWWHASTTPSTAHLEARILTGN